MKRGDPGIPTTPPVSSEWLHLLAVLLFLASLLMGSATSWVLILAALAGNWIAGMGLAFGVSMSMFVGLTVGGIKTGSGERR